MVKRLSCRPKASSDLEMVNPSHHSGPDAAVPSLRLAAIVDTTVWHNVTHVVLLAFSIEVPVCSRP